jgi:dienelactone hydrolase
MSPFPHSSEAPLTPPYSVDAITHWKENTGGNDDETVFITEARLLFRDWLDREVSIFARRSLRETGSNGGAVLHIVGGAQTIHPGDLAVWNSLGYAAASFDWQLKGVGNRPPERTSVFPDGVVSQAARTNSFSAAMIPVAIQAAAVCLDWLAQAPGVDPGRLGVVGISWGAYLSWNLAASSPRVKALVPAFGCGGIFRHPAEDLGQEESEVRHFWETHWEPPAIAYQIKAPVCYLNGTNDFFGDPLVAEQLLAHLRVPHLRSYLPNVDHSLNPAQTRLAQAWMDHYLLGGPALPSLPDFETTEPTQRWWSEEPSGSSFHRCWLPGPPPADREILSFAQHEIDGLLISSSILNLNENEGQAAVREKAVSPDPIPFGLGWRWEIGSTRLFDNEASAFPLDAQATRWQVTPARPGNDSEGVTVLIHPVARASLNTEPGATLRLGWSHPFSTESAAAVIHLREAGGEPLQASVTWDSVRSCIKISPGSGASGTDEKFDWKTAGRIQISSQQGRTPFVVGPLEWVD